MPHPKLESMAEDGHLDCQMRCAIEYMVERDEKKGFEWFLRAFEEHKDVEAMVALAGCYDGGSGVEASALESMRWYHRAAVGGNSEAAFRLACFYFAGNASDRSRLFEITAEKIGADNSIRDWASSHWWSKPAILEPEFTNLEAALNWYRRAAEKGHVHAMHELGCRLMEFYDAEDTNPHEAISLFEKATKLKHPGATYRLALAYQVGAAGLEPNPEKAHQLFQKAADLGEPLAANFLLPSADSDSSLRRRRCFYPPCSVFEGTTTSGLFSPKEKNKTFKRCARCRTAYYCSPACQKKDWPRHKENCT